MSSEAYDHVAAAGAAAAIALGRVDACRRSAIHEQQTTMIPYSFLVMVVVVVVL